MTYYCIMAEFYNSQKPKACITTRDAPQKPKNQYVDRPEISAFKIWFLSPLNANTLLSDIKRGCLDLNDMLEFYSGITEATEAA